MAQDNRLRHENYGFIRDYIAMTTPLLLMAFFLYGPRVLFLLLAAVITARLCDRLAAFLRNRRFDRTENSSILISIIIVLLMPATVGYHVVVVAVVVAVLIAKEAFGGVGSYPFNPAAVGFCVVAASWPESVLRYPSPNLWPLARPFNWEQVFSLWRFEGVVPAEGPSAILKHGALPNIDSLALLLGDYAAPLGVTSTLVIVACCVYLFIKKRLSLAAPLSFLVVAALVAFLFPRIPEITFQTWPVDIPDRLNVMKYELLSGAMLFSAIFLVNEPITLPKYTSTRIIYGAVLGVATMMFRYYGIFELGTCFAILLVNAASGPFDRIVERRSQRKEAAKT